MPCAVRLPVYSSAKTVRVGDESEVRHFHHDRDTAEHDDDGDRTLRTTSAARGRALHHQPDIHRHLHARMRHEDHRRAPVLLPRAVERLRLCRCHLVHFRQETSTKQ